MNLRQPYEQLIADKLRKLPVPDADASWQQMKQLLDDDKDKGGGTKRPPGNNNGWWRIGIIAIVLSASLWLYIEKTSPNTLLAKNNTTAPSAANNQPAEKENGSLKSIPVNNQKATIDNNTTLPLTIATPDTKSNNKINTGVADKSNSADNSKNINTSKNEVTAVITKTNESNSILLSQTAADKKYTTVKNGRKNLEDAANNSVADVSSFSKAKRSTGIAANNSTDENPEIISRKYTGKEKYIAYKTNNNKSRINNKYSINLYTLVNQTAAANEKPWFGKINELEIAGNVPAANTSLSLGDSIESNRNVTNLLNNETKKQVAKAKRDKELEDMSKKEKKSFHLDLSNVFKPFSLHIDTDPRWAAGISLNSAITVNAQSRYNYNMNAKSGTLTDYIPSVYLQFHLNDYVYAQTEINFISPQYTPQLLVYQQTNNSLAQNGISNQRSIYIQKLYYFNLPVSLHYSPINNFYFSAGLQFSSFQSGLVSIQDKQYATLTGPDHPTSISNSVVKFKDDSIAVKLSPNEWRWQVGADYYWNRFSFGMRYNKSFKNLLNVTLSNSLPPTTLRNESLIFFVRYNLFESRKKGEPSQKH